MAFQKNWRQFIVSKGEPFKIEYLDRKYGGRPETVFEVTEDGVVSVDGVELTGDQNVAGSIVATAAITAGTTVTGADVVATDDLTVGDDAAIGGDLAVTGTSTFTGLAALPAASFHSYCTQGNNGTGHITATGVKIGDKVIMVANTTDHVSSASSFESTVTVADQIQQSSASDLSAKTLVILVLAQS